MDAIETKLGLLHFLKQNRNWITLILILAFAFSLRLYHLDYPVVGYHNWKETHYLTESRNFERDGFFEHGFFVPAWDYPALTSNPSGAHSDTFPTTSVATALFFKLFGYELWAARLLSVLFIVGALLMFYLVIKALFKRDDLALISAAVMAINPLLVFFGRQVQLINPAMFFTMFGLYFYLRWLEDGSLKNTALFSVPLFLGIMTKYTFALLLIPMFFIFPINHLLSKDRWKTYTVIIVVIALSGWWMHQSSSLLDYIANQTSPNKLKVLLDGLFWKTMLSYAKDNYTLTGLCFSLTGLVVFVLSYNKNKNNFGYKFMLYYFLGSLLWFTVVAYKLKGHSYHQYPIAPLIVFFIAYAFVFIGNVLGNSLGVNGLKLPLAFTLVLILLVPSIEAKNRMFNTQFYGLDIAGDYVKQHKLPGERIMHSGHQAFGVLWHADMKGTRRIPATRERIKFAEDNLNARWMFIYIWDFGMMRDKEKWDYIEGNYEIKQVGMINYKRPQILYLLLRKGGKFSVSKIGELLVGKPKKTRNYELSQGSVVVYYANFD